jgi:hypothetical protein
MMDVILSLLAEELLKLKTLKKNVKGTRYQHGMH